VLVLTAAVETPQHQEKIDDIGFGAGPACLQFDVIQFELAQLKLQFGQIRGLSGQELFVGQALQLFLFGMQVQIQSRCAPRWRVQRWRFGEFRSENRLIGCRWGSERPTVEVG